MIVVDASVVVEALLVGGVAAVRISDTDVHVPHLLDAEVVSAIRGRTLGGHVGVDLAGAAVRVLGELEMERHSHVALLGRAWALRANLTVYDALYVALAETLDVPLVTADAGIAACPGIRTAIELLPA